MNIKFYDGDCPSEDEEYMGESQLHYFTELLRSRRKELINTTDNYLSSLQEMSMKSADDVDVSAKQAAVERDYRQSWRIQKLIEQVDHALSRIDEGEYGYCEITGEEIGLKRMLARPTASLCVEIQEQYERRAGARGGYATAQ